MPKTVNFPIPFSDLTVCPGASCEAAGREHRHCPLDAGTLLPQGDLAGGVPNYGADVDDGVACECCGAWQHTRCARFIAGNKPYCIDCVVTCLGVTRLPSSAARCYLANRVPPVLPKTKPRIGRLGRSPVRGLRSIR